MKTKEKTFLTDEDRSFIWENYLSVPVSEMAIKLGKQSRLVYDFVYANDLTPFIRPRGKKVITVAEGMFDDSENENWLV